MEQAEEELGGGGRSAVHRKGGVVYRSGGPWSKSVISFLRHLENAGFQGAPRVVGSGFDDQGRETLAFIEGAFVHPEPWPEGAMFRLGELLRELHKAGASFEPSDDAIWRPWFGRTLGGDRRVFGHCDFSPWNIVARDGLPVALIDWETAGPVDALVELGQACWLNAQLHDDDVARRVGLASPEERARHAALICDGYQLPKSDASRLVQAMIDVAIADAADQAVDAKVTPELSGPLWGISWRARASAWMIRHRQLLIRALG